MPVPPKFSLVVTVKTTYPVVLLVKPLPDILVLSIETEPAILAKIPSPVIPKIPVLTSRALMPVIVKLCPLVIPVGIKPEIVGRGINSSSEEEIIPSAPLIEIDPLIISLGTLRIAPVVPTIVVDLDWTKVPVKLVK